MISSKILLTILINLFFFVNCASSKDSLIWIEAEQADKTNMKIDGQFKPLNDNEENKLSGGAWLNGVPQNISNAFAEYKFEVTKTGKYKFYVRKFYSHGPFRWKLDDGKWNDVDVHPGALQEQGIRKLVTATWISPGEVELKAGKHKLRIELLYRKDLNKFSNAFAFDCFVFTPTFFVPNGKYNPQKQVGLADKGMWAFETPTDEFKDSDIDLRYLNENVAGENGFVKAVGNDFVLANGEKVKFWCVNFHNVHLDYQSIKYIARQYAKAGVNMVRLFIPVLDDSIETDDPFKLDKHIQEGYYKAVAAFKAEGIYIKICPYFSLTARLREAWGINGYHDYLNSWYKPFGVLFFDKRLQEIYKTRIKKLFTTKNPYTGLTLADDPSIAIIQTQNEDGLFFSTFSGLFPMKKKSTVL